MFKNSLTLFQLNEVILEKMYKVKLSKLTQVSQLAAIVDKATGTSEFMSEQAMVGLTLLVALKRCFAHMATL